MGNIIGKLFEIRKDQKIKQKTMCKHLGVSSVTIRKWENGNAKIPLDMAELYATALDYELRLLKK